VLEILNDEGVRDRVSPENVMKYAGFMATVGSIKQRPVRWRNPFFDDMHGPGNRLQGR